MSSGPMVKTQLEMQEEKNRRMIEAEEQKWLRDQIHMEAQIRNTIEQTHAVKKTVERDQERMRKKEEERIRKEKEMAKRNKEREEHMKSVLDTANKAKKDWINKEVRKFKKIQKDFATELRESMDIWDNYKNDPEALAKHSLARLRKLNETYDPEHLRASAMNRSSHSAAAKSEKGKDSSMSPDGEGGHNSSAKSGRATTPEYIRQRRKYEEHMNAKYSGNSKNAQELEQKIQELERKNRERDMIIAGHRQAVNEKMRSALSEIEKNQQEAAKKLKKKMEETVHVYVEKQIKGEDIRKKHSEEEHKKLVAARKQFEERLKEAALRKVDEDKKKNKKLKMEQAKKIEKLQKMAVRKEEEARERHARSIEKDQKIHTVLHNHEEIMEEHAQMGMQLMQGIREKAEKIEEKKRIELQMVEDRKKHLAELEKEKLHFKKMFGNFEVDEGSQKRALERLKSYGIKSTALKETIKRIEAEEAEKLKAKNKKKNEEEEN